MAGESGRDLGAMGSVFGFVLFLPFMSLKAWRFTLLFMSFSVLIMTHSQSLWPHLTTDDGLE